MDYDLFLKIAARFNVLHVPRDLANFKWWGNNKSAVGGRARLAEIERITAPFGGRGLPAYTRLEAAFLDVREAAADARRAKPLGVLGHLATAVGRVAGSPRTWRSLASPACWRVMWTGQILRRHVCP